MRSTITSSTLHPRRVESVGPDLAAVLPAAASAETPAAPAAGAAERFRYHRAVRALLELLARERPVALLLDDLHWADEASVELVLHLLRRPPRGPLLLAFALRPHEPAPRLLDAARGAPGWVHLAPGPLADDAARALVAELPEALRERVVREAGGNPLFLEELRRVANAPDGALPPTLMAAVGLEIGALPAASRALIEGAAVAGDPFDPELAAVAAGLDDAARVLEPLDRLVAADLVRSTGDGRAFAFRHPLVRRAVYDAAPPAWRLGAHERVAAALAVRGAGPAARADHVARYARQGDLEAVELLAAAAATAADTAPAAAARLYSTAVGLLPDADVERRPALLGPLALAQAASGQLEQARDSLDEVLRLLPPEPPGMRVWLIAAAATIELMLGEIAQQQRRLLAALERVPPEHSAVLELTMGGSQYYTLDYAAMREWAGRAAAHARDDEPSVLAAAEAMGGLARLMLGEPVEGQAMIDSSLQRIAALDDATLATRLDHPYMVAAGALLAERFGDALAPITRAMAIARGTRQDRMIPMLAGLRSMMVENLLRMDEAMEEADTALEGARLLGKDAQLHPALMMQSQIRWLRGERAEAERAAAESVEVARRTAPSTATVTTHCNAAALWAEEQPERCIREMVEAAGPGLERADQSWRTWLLAQLVRAALALGRLDDAERWTAEIEERAELTGTPGAQTRAAASRAGVLVARGEPAAGAALAAEAADAAEAAGVRLDGIAARLAAGRALAAAGDRAAAVAAFQRVASDAGQGGAGLFVEAAARELRKLGSRLPATTRRAGAVDAGELSGREREIAELVAGGRSNKQVAAALFLSEKTIEHHLSRIYAKVGVRSRAELAARMAR